GNSSVPLSYFGTDENPYTGVSYYRLKQVDFDGAVHYPGHWVRIDNMDAHTLLISPNPNDGKQFTLSLSSCQDENAQVQILNDMGKIVWEQLVDLRNNDDGLLHINTGRNFDAGMYTLRVTCISEQQTTRFIIQRKEK